MLLLILVLSCGKNLSVDSVNQYGQIRKSEVCSAVDLNQNYLEQKNLEKIYECLAWNHSAPELLNFIQSFNPDSWSKAFAEINKNFLGRNSKDKFFNYLLVLRNSNELTSLQDTFYQILQKDSAYDLLNKLFNQLEKERVNPNEVLSYRNLSQVVSIYDDLFIEILANQKKLVSSTDFSKDEIENDLIAMLDVFSKSIEKQPKKFSNGVSNFLTGLNESWFEANFLVDETKLPKTIKYVKSIFPQMKNTVFNVRELLEKEVTVCQSGGDSIVVNHKVEVFEKLHFVTENNLSAFLAELNDLVLKYGFWREVCSTDKNFIKDLDTINATLIFVSDFVAAPERFELFRNLLYATSEGNIEDYDKLLTFLLSDDLEALITFVDKYLNQNSEFSKVVIGLLGSLDVSFFRQLSSLFSEISNKDEVVFSFLAKFWNSLNVVEKRDFLSIVLLPLYEKDQTVSHLSHLFVVLQNDYPKELKKVFEDFKKIYTDNKIYYEVMRPLTNKVLFEELKSLIKNNGLISLLNLVLPTDRKLEHKKPVIKILAHKVEKVINPDELECNNEIIRANLEGREFSEMINNMPKSCSYNNDSFMVKIYKAIKVINDSSSDQAALFADKGIFSSHFLKLHAALFLTNDLEFKIREKYKKQSLDNALKIFQVLYLYADQIGIAKPIVEELVNSFVSTDQGAQTKSPTLSVPVEEALKKRNERSLVTELLKTFNKNPQNIISKRNRDARPLYFDLSTFVELLYDLSDPSLKENIIIKTNGSIHELELTPLEAIETAFENMQFAHNHYAAYAVNKLSSAYDFDKELKRFQGNLKKMRFSFSLFSRLNYVETADREKIENLNETFDAFWHLKRQVPKYGQQSYIDLIQNLLKAVVEASKDGQRNLKLLTKPKKETENDHAVIALLEIMSNRTLSQLAAFFKMYIAPTKEAFFTQENIELISFLQLNLQDPSLHLFIDAVLEKNQESELTLSFDTIKIAFYAAKIISKNRSIYLSELVSLINFESIPYDLIADLSPLLSEFLERLSTNENFVRSFKKYYTMGQVKNVLDSLTKIEWNQLSPFEVNVHSKSNLLKIVNAYRISFQENLGHESSRLVYDLIDSLMGDEKKFPLEEVVSIILNSEGENLEEFLEAMKKKVTVLIQ